MLEEKISLVHSVDKNMKLANPDTDDADVEVI
jgi:hypothetical protein